MHLAAPTNRAQLTTSPGTFPANKFHPYTMLLKLPLNGKPLRECALTLALMKWNQPARTDRVVAATLDDSKRQEMFSCLHKTSAVA